MAWIERLVQYATEKGITVLRIEEPEWVRLENSKKGLSEFTIVRSHESLHKAKKKDLLVLISSDSEGNELLRFGVIKSKRSVATLESRIKVVRCNKITVYPESRLVDLPNSPGHAKIIVRKLSDSIPVVHFPPRLSGHLIERLASNEFNIPALRQVLSYIGWPNHFSGNQATQLDAVNTALSVFGLSQDHQAESLEITKSETTALSQVSILEDAVIEHDAREIPGYDLVRSDFTGRAVFRKQNEQLEVFTANRRPLERCLGVDLIYHNVTKKSLVMLQYKMLDRQNDDWIYRPDEQLNSEIARMEKLEVKSSPKDYEYRLNPTMLYFKFVKRNAKLSDPQVIMPLDHLRKILEDDRQRGPRGGVRISFNSLSGYYLRRSPFHDLLNAGYIGGYSDTTAHIRVLIDQILEGNKSVIAAIQRPLR